MKGSSIVCVETRGVSDPFQVPQLWGLRPEVETEMPPGSRGRSEVTSLKII